MNNVKDADIGMMLFGVTASIQGFKELADNPHNRKLLFRDIDQIRDARDQLNKIITLVNQARGGRLEAAE